MPQQEGIVCPECNTSNEAGWSFCQQCGKRLPKSPAPPSSGELKSARGLTTVPDQQAVSGASSAQDLRTHAEKSPAGEHSLKTVAEKSPATEDGIKTVAEKVFQADEAAKTVAEKSPAIEPKRPVEAPSPVPAKLVEPSAQPPSKADPWADLPTVVTEVPPRPTADTPVPAMPVRNKARSLRRQRRTRLNMCSRCPACCARSAGRPATSAARFVRTAARRLSLQRQW